MPSEVHAELCLPIFKVGDDIAQCLESNAGAVPDGLREYAQLLEDAAVKVRALARAADSGKLTVHAGTHYVGVAGPADLIDGLIRDGVLVVPDEDDEDDEAADLMDDPDGFDDEE